jgi:uncharacterized delta-60 repeat protein
MLACQVAKKACKVFLRLSNKTNPQTSKKAINMKQTLFLIALLACAIGLRAQQIVTFDSTFATYGIETDFAVGDNAHYTSKVLSNGNIVCGSSQSINGIQQGQATWYTSTGTINTAMGNNGMTAIGPNYVVINCKEQSNGQVLMCGYIGYNVYYYEGFVVRFGTNGLIDSSFGTYGIYKRVVPNKATYINDIGILSNGEALLAVGGVDTPTNTSETSIIKLNSNGTLNTTYNNSGAVNFTPNEYFDIRDVLITSTDQPLLVLSDYEALSTGTISVIKLKTNGSLDSTFGTYGKYYISNPNYDLVTGRMALQSNGKIIVSGSRYNSTVHNEMYFRLNPNGTLDNTFATNGTFVSSYNAGNGWINQAQLIVDNQDRILSYVSNNGGANSSYNCIRRFKSNGQIDSSFNNNNQGIYNPQQIAGSNFRIGGLGIQADGKIVYSGYDINSNIQTFSFLARVQETTAPPATLSLSSPNGGEQWNVGSSQSINWQSANMYSVNLAYTVDGVNWTPIASNVSAALGTYNWMIPNTPGTNCKVAISDANTSALSDTSNLGFSITYPNSLTNSVDQANLDIFPIPTSDVLHIAYKGNINYAYQVFNSTGNLICSGKLLSDKTISVANWPVGIYYLKINSSSPALVRKICIE